MFANGDGTIKNRHGATDYNRSPCWALVETRWHSSDTNEKIRSIIVVSHSKNM